MRVLKYYVENKALFGHENKVNENKVLPYCKVLRCETIKNNEKIVFLYTIVNHDLWDFVPPTFTAISISYVFQYDYPDTMAT